MKYYVYISDAKVDMLFPQVPHDIKKKVATEWKMDLKLLSASRRVETEGEDNRIARLEAVVEFIREFGNIGSADEPDQYVEDSLPMKWGLFEGSPDDSVVYFGGQSARTIVGLGGSMRHVIGSASTSYVFAASATPFLMKVLSKELEMSEPTLDEELSRRPDIDEFPLRAVQLAWRRMSGPSQNMEFLAKRLLYDPKPGALSQLASLLCTPLYVAMAD
jgi:hypothetical protein